MIISLLTSVVLVVVSALLYREKRKRGVPTTFDRIRLAFSLVLAVAIAVRTLYF